MQALVLQRREIGEFDQIISLYTEERGRVDLLAKGVKRITSKNSAHLEPFSLVQVDWVKGKELDRLLTAQSLQVFSPIRKDGQKSWLASAMMSVLARVLSPGEKDPRLFALVVQWLDLLATVPQTSDLFADALVLRVLSILGFSPELTKCADCGQPVAKNFVDEKGGLVCDQCRGTAQGTLLSGEEIVDLQLLCFASWEQIFSLNLAKITHKRIHDLVYHFLCFVTEKSLPDWKTNLTIIH